MHAIADNELSPVLERLDEARDFLEVVGSPFAASSPAR
jgi:hypothetical protein